MTDLDTFGGGHSVATAINDGGVVVGEMSTPGGGSGRRSSTPSRG